MTKFCSPFWDRQNLIYIYGANVEGCDSEVKKSLINRVQRLAKLGLQKKAMR